MILRRVAVMMLALGSAAAGAQQVASAAGTGMVTGHVTCGDTQRPARLANITLLGVPKEAAPMPKMDPNADPEAMMAAMKTAMDGLKNTTMVNTQTDMNGAFVAENVAPGDYYVFAAKAGYVQPLNQVQAALEAGADASKPLPGIAVVHVVAEHTANAEVTIDRGAAVSGTVQFDDGTPVTGGNVLVVQAKGDPKQPPPQFAMLAAMGGLSGIFSVTDDLGHYRVSGLAPGEYVVQITLPLKNLMNMTAGAMNFSKMMSEKPLVAYAPATFHKADAKAIKLGTGEDKRDVMVTYNLNGMHTVSGRVASLEDHHGLNSATVTVTDANDKDFVRSAGVDAAGNFSVTLVPAGTYSLKVSDAGDTEPAKKDDKEKPALLSFAGEHTLKSYDDLEQSLIVTDSDVAGLDLELKTSKTVKKDLDLGDFLPH
jgi:hypothetical protein